MSRLSNIVQILIKAKDDASPALKKIWANTKQFASDIQTKAAIWFGAVSAWIFVAVEAASALEETTNKFWVTFSNVLPKAQKYANELWNWYLFAKEESLNLLSATWDLLTWFGFTQDKALWLSNEVQKLAADLASFNNLEWGATQASKALTSWLLWEREQMKALGIVIRDTDIQQELLRTWKNKLTGMSLLQAKAEITLQLALWQSKNAIWDVSRSMDSYANQKRDLIRQTKDLTAVFGQWFLPVAKEIIATLKPIIESTTEWIKNNQELTTNIALATVWLLAFWLVFAPILSVLSSTITIIWVLSTAIKWLYVLLAANPIWAIIAWITLLIVWFIAFRDEIWSFSKWITDFFSNLAEKFPILWNIIRLLMAPFLSLFYLLQGIVKLFDFIFWKSGSKEVKITNDTNLTQWALSNNAWLWVNKTGKTGNQEVNINMWGVTVNNEADEDRLVKKIKDSFIREKTFARQGVVY